MDVTFDALGKDALKEGLTPTLGNRGVVSEEIAPFINEIGKGYDSPLGDRRSLIVKGQLVEQPIPGIEDTELDSARYILLEDQHSYSRLTNKMAQAKARFKLISGAASYSGNKEITSNSYSLHVSAFVRRTDSPFVFDTRSIVLDTNAATWLAKNVESGARTRQFGDRVITGIIPGNEMLVDLRIQTRNATEKRSVLGSISASYARLVSGSGSLSEVVTSASAAKSIDISVVSYGEELTRLPKTPDAIERDIRSLLRNDSGTSVILRYITNPVRDFIINGETLEFIDGQELQQRYQAAISFGENSEYLDQAEQDAEYVVATPSEFIPADVERAAGDLDIVRGARSELAKLYSKCVGEFQNTGRNSRLINAVIEFPIPSLDEYFQKEPNPPRPKSRRKRPWYKL